MAMKQESWGGSSQSQYESRTTLIINYLPSEITEKQVYDIFVAMGEIQSCKLVKNPEYPGKHNVILLFFKQCYC